MPIIEEIEEKTRFRIKRDKDGTVEVGIGKYVYFCFSEVAQETVRETLQYDTLYERLLKKGVPAKHASRAIAKLGPQYVQKLAYSVELDKSDKMIDSKLKVLISKMSKAIALMECHAEKKRRRIELSKKRAQKKKKEVHPLKIYPREAEQKTPFLLFAQEGARRRRHCVFQKTSNQQHPRPHL